MNRAWIARGGMAFVGMIMGGAAFAQTGDFHDAFMPLVATARAPLFDEALARLNDRALSPFRPRVDRRTGFASSVSGGKWLATGSVAERSIRFFTENGALFGLDPRFELRAIPYATQDDRASFLLFRDGIEVDAVSAWTRFDDSGALISASLRSPQSGAIGSGFTTTKDAAIATARDAIASRRKAERASFPLAEAKATIATQVYIAAPTGLVPAWRIDIPSTDRHEAWRALVDAGTGVAMGARDRTQYATKGFLPTNYDGQFITFTKFTLGTAKSRVFASQSAAINGLSSKKTVKNFASKGVPAANVDKGFIVGARSNVFDFFGDDPFQPNLVFDYDPFDPSTLSNGIPRYDAFDCANINYQLELFYQHLTKNLGLKQLASNLAVPIIVNDPQTDINAFFSPSVWPDAMNPITVGFMDFFDLTNSVNDVAADLSRDPVVACHEYTHGWLFYENLPFDDTIDFPPRAVGEALPDFFATTLHQDNQVGRYTGIVLQNGVPIRQLQDDDLFPDTTLESLVDDDPTAGILLMPEEHASGEVIGSFLLDARDLLGGKAMERLVFSAMPSMPHTMADIGYTSNQVFANPIAATGDYFFECALELANQTLSQTQFEVIYGSATGRGIFNDANSGHAIAVNLEPLKNHQLVAPTDFPRANGSRQFLFRAKQGRKLSIVVQSDSGATLNPDFVLSSSTGLGGDFTLGSAKQTSANGKTVSQSNITLNMPLTANPSNGDPFYILTVSAVSGLGYYTVFLDV